MNDRYVHVLMSEADEDPFKNPDKFISNGNTEQWEHFLNGGYTREEPDAPGFYLVLWLPRKGAKDMKAGVATACRAKNNKKRFIWEDPHLRKFVVSRSTLPIPPFLG